MGRHGVHGPGFRIKEAEAPGSRSACLRGSLGPGQGGAHADQLFITASGAGMQLAILVSPTLKVLGAEKERELE